LTDIKTNCRGKKNVKQTPLFLFYVKNQVAPQVRNRSYIHSRNVLDVDWGLVVKLALSGKITRRAYKVF
jgi:hypothetical protein